MSPWENITDAAGMKIQQISFDKGAPRYGALLGGQVDACLNSQETFLNFLMQNSSANPYNL